MWYKLAIAYKSRHEFEKWLGYSCINSIIQYAFEDALEPYLGFH
jgi:hypothetical protein